MTAVIAAFVLPVNGKFVLKASALIIEFKSSPNLKHYRFFALIVQKEPITNTNIQHYHVIAK